MQKTKNKNPKPTISQKITIAVLLILAVQNIVFAIILGSINPLIASVFYSFITYLCLRKKDYRAGAISGIVGAILHIRDLLSENFYLFSSLEKYLIISNIVLPVLLIFSGYKAHRELKEHQTGKK